MYLSSRDVNISLEGGGGIRKSCDNLSRILLCCALSKNHNQPLGSNFLNLEINLLDATLLKSNSAIKTPSPHYPPKIDSLELYEVPFIEIFFCCPKHKLHSLKALRFNTLFVGSS